MKGLAPRSVLVLAAWASLTASAGAQALVDDWSTRCAMFRGVLGWVAAHPGDVREPMLSGEFSRPADDALFFGGAPLPAGIPTRLAAKPSTGSAFAFGPSLRCQTLKYRKPDVDILFDTPVIADDYAAVDLQQVTAIDDDTTFGNTTRFVLHQTAGQWRVLRAMTFESHRFHIEI